MFARFMAQQLSHPSGLIGPLAAHAWNRRNAGLNDAIFDRLALSPADRVLEVGFGGGYLLGRMSTVVTAGLLAGVDVSPAMVAFCARRYRPIIRQGRLALKCAPVESLPYPPEVFTKVCTVNSIFYWQSVQRALAEFHRVLTGNGFAVICFTCKESLRKRSFARHVALYEADEIEQMAISCGFQVTTEHLSDRHRDFLCIIARKQS